MSKGVLSGGQLYQSVLKTHPLLWFLEGNKPLFLELQSHPVCWDPCSTHSVISAREHLCCCFLHFNFLLVSHINHRTPLPCNKSTTEWPQPLEVCMVVRSWQCKLFETMSFLQHVCTGPCTGGAIEIPLPAWWYSVVPAGANSTAVWERNGF